jgi:O-antigen/teichoic acid export membrane protein
MNAGEEVIAKPKFSLKDFFSKGHQRSVKAKKNILFLFLAKGVSVMTSFVLVPLTIDYLTPVNYGIWLTLYSIISWFGLLDIGLGNGLRNKVAEAISAGDHQTARVYLSTSYALLGIIMTSACLLFTAVNQFLDWPALLNISTVQAHELKKIMLVIFGFFCMQLVVKLISSVLLADQRTAMAGIINTISSLVSLAVVFVLTKTTEGSLLYLALAIGSINVLVPLAVSFWFYRGPYKKYTPALSHVNMKYGKKLMDVGLMFFLFQSTALIVVATDNIIISRLFGPEEVTPYNIALKYFTPLTIVFGLFSNPLWSAYTEAYNQDDMGWIKRTTRKMMRLWLLLAAAAIPMVLLSGIAYQLWIGDKVQIPFGLTALMAVYMLVSSWNQIFGNFINGVGKLRLAFFLTIFTALVNIPLCIMLADYAGWGLAGIIAASSLSLLPDLIFLPIQYRKIVNRTARGIWNK